MRQSQSNPSRKALASVHTAFISSTFTPDEEEENERGEKPIQAAESGASSTFRRGWCFLSPFHPVVPFLILVYLYFFFSDFLFT